MRINEDLQTIKFDVKIAKCLNNKKK